MMTKNEYIYKRDILASLNKIAKSLELIAESLKISDCTCDQKAISSKFLCPVHDKNSNNGRC